MPATSIVALGGRVAQISRCSSSSPRSFVSLRSIRSVTPSNLVSMAPVSVKETRSAIIARAGSTEDVPQTPNQTNATAGLWAVWAFLVGYAVFFSPNLTPLRDQYFLEKLVNLGVDDGVKINQIFVALFNIMGVIPGIYASLLIPGARSANRIPAWPFVAGSFFLGAFALVPYMAMWQPKEESDAPPKAEDFEGVKGYFMRAMESPVTPVLLLAAAAYQIYMVATASGAQWEAYGHLLDESRFVHVTTLDFLTLTALMPFWMSNDATARNWDKKDSLIPVLTFIPILGPLTYLILRPKGEAPK